MSKFTQGEMNGAATKQVIYRNKLGSQSSIRITSKRTRYSMSSLSRVNKNEYDPQPLFGKQFQSFILKTIEKVQAYFSEAEVIRKKAMKTGNPDIKHKILLKENHIFRKGLKELNDFLNKFIDYAKDLKAKKLSGMGYRYGNNGKLKKTRGTQSFVHDFI